MKQVFGLSIILACAVASYNRSLVWQAEKSIWAEAARVSPESPRPHINLGIELEKEEKYDAALTEFNQALLLSQTANRMQKHQRMSAAAAESNIALIFLVKGQWQDAIRRSDRALEYHPGLASAYVNKGMAYLIAGRCDLVAEAYILGGGEKLPRCAR